MENKRKLLAACFISIILIHTTGTVFSIGIHNAFAYTNSTYEVENVVFFNATVLGKSQTIKLVISEDSSETYYDYQSPDGKIYTKAHQGPGLAPNATTTNIGTFGIMNRQNIAGQFIEFAGKTFDVSSASYGFINTWFNGSNILENSSEYFGENGFQSMDSLSFPVIEKLVLFDSPFNYAVEWCDANDYVFDSMVNSTYVEYFDTDSLNLFDAKLVKTDWMVTENLANSSDYLTMSLMEFGGSLLPEDFGLSLLIIGLIAFFVGPMIIDACLTSQRIQATKDLASAQIVADMLVTITAINAERDVQIELVSAKATNEALILTMLENGTLTFEEASALLDGIGADYSALISNRSSNIVDALTAYYNHTEEQWDDYLNGIAVGSSWTDYLQLIIMFVIVFFVIYVIYALFLRKKNLGTSSNIYVVR